MSRRTAATAGIVLPLAAAAGIVAVEAWHGPVVLLLSADHGVDAGDLPALPLVALAIAVARSQAVTPARKSWAAPASAITLATLMLLAGVVAKAGGGPLVPSGGGTLDGTIRQTAATNPVEVDRWSDVAVTYDGGTLRLYVNGRQVSSHATAGLIQTPANPLWIGGNAPYGEHFRGLIDEVRIYDYALSESEIRRDMAMPVTPARGLAAGYSFDAGSGTLATDSSGNDNTGEVRNATWARGRYGEALRFDGETAVVRVPPSPSLNLTHAMTLSGWIRPEAPQAGWRTIVQRQTDAYLLAASSDRQSRTGAIDDLRAGLLLAAVAWFCVVIATARGPWTAARRRSWWLPVALFTLGSLADAALAPSVAFVGPTLVVLWLAATAPAPVERIALTVAAGACVGLMFGSLADGAVARTAALGALFAIAGVSQLAARARVSDVAAPQHVSRGP